MICPKCGFEQPESDECASCGIIVSNYERYVIRQNQLAEQAKQGRQTGGDQKDSAIKSAFTFSFKSVLFAVVAFGLLGVGGVLAFKKKQENDYINSLIYINTTMAASMSTCTDMCGTYSRTWRKAIEDDLDFNVELLTAKMGFEQKGDFAKIGESKKRIEAVFQTLTAPPEKFKIAHQKMVELFGVYSQIHSLAMSPSGSLMSFNQRVNDLEAGYVKSSNELKILIPSNG